MVMVVAVGSEGVNGLVESTSGILGHNHRVDLGVEARARSQQSLAVVQPLLAVHCVSIVAHVRVNFAPGQHRAVHLPPHERAVYNVVLLRYEKIVEGAGADVPGGDLTTVLAIPVPVTVAEELLHQLFVETIREGP
jgi:hypothetical protein